MKIERTRLLGTPPIIPNVCEGPGVPGLVSVLIPTYNRAYILRSSLDSVIAQTYQDVEIIVVDDGSKDDTKSIVDSYGGRIRYIYQENAGLAAARNTGLGAARGEFLAFQDSDDAWFPWKLEAQVAVMRQVPELAIVWTDMTSVTPDGKVFLDKHLRTGYGTFRKIDVDDYLTKRGSLGDLANIADNALRQVAFSYGDIFGLMALGNIVHPPTAMMRRSCVTQSGGLDVTFAWTCEDYEFFWRVSQFGPAALIDAPSMFYRIEGEDQLTRPDLLFDVARGYITTLDRHFERHRRRIDLPPKLLRQHLADSYRWVGREELLSERGRRRNAVMYLGKSMAFEARRSTLTLLLAAVFVPRQLFSAARDLKKRLA